MQRLYSAFKDKLWKMISFVFTRVDKFDNKKVEGFIDKVIELLKRRLELSGSIPKLQFFLVNCKFDEKDPADNEKRL